MLPSVFASREQHERAAHLVALWRHPNDPAGRDYFLHCTNHVTQILRWRQDGAPEYVLRITHEEADRLLLVWRIEWRERLLRRLDRLWPTSPLGQADAYARPRWEARLYWATNAGYLRTTFLEPAHAALASAQALYRQGCEPQELEARARWAAVETAHLRLELEITRLRAPAREGQKRFTRLAHRNTSGLRTINDKRNERSRALQSTVAPEAARLRQERERQGLPKYPKTALAILLRRRLNLKETARTIRKYL